MVKMEAIVYDDLTLKRLREMPDKFDENTTLNVKLLCSRERSGMGSHIVRVCENLGIRLKCAKSSSRRSSNGIRILHEKWVRPIQRNAACVH